MIISRTVELGLPSLTTVAYMSSVNAHGEDIDPGSGKELMAHSKQAE